jgi:hypothetical protein
MLTYSCDGATTTHEAPSSNTSHNPNIQIDSYHPTHSAHTNADHVGATSHSSVAATGKFNLPWLFSGLFSKVPPWLRGVPRGVGHVLLRVPLMEACVRYALMFVTGVGKRAEGLLCDLDEANEKRGRRKVGE